MKLKGEYWFLDKQATGRNPAFTTGNRVQAFVDGRSYFADLHTTLGNCDQTLLIAGWRVSSGQVLAPERSGEGLSGETFIDAVRHARRLGAEVKSLLFNVPGTDMPGPFRLWHAHDNREFCDEIIKIGGDSILDSRLADVPASSHHQKFIVALSRDPSRSAAYLGGIDVCYDRWDHPPHDNCAERQRDFIREGCFETHQPSQPGWHDVQVKLQGPAISQMFEVFRSRWNDPRPPNRDPFLASYRGNTRLEPASHEFSGAGSAEVQINLTLPEGVFPQEGGSGEQTIARAQERAIGLAEHYIYVEDQYVWPCSLVEHLEAALKRGVRVLLMVARDYDAPGLSIISHRLRGEVVDRLRAAGGNLFKIHHLERDNGEQIYVHSKLIIIDDCFVSIGSANFNARSLVNDTEIQASIVDSEPASVPFSGVSQTVSRFAHDLRCQLWAEHLEQDRASVIDPIASFDGLWSQAPISPSRRAVPHVVKHGLINIDAIAEFITTLVEKRFTHVPHLTLPPGVSDRSAIKLAVDTAMRGPFAAGFLKFMEEMLNPDLTSTFATVKRSAQEAFTELISPLQHTPDSSLAGPVVDTQRRLQAELVVRKLRKGQMPKMVDWIDPVLLGMVAVRTLISSTIDFTEKPVTATSTRQSAERLAPKSAGSMARMFEATEFHAPNFYPERWRSRLLVLRNLWLPFHNWRFGILLGLIYMIFGWVFQLSVADPLDGLRQSRYAQADVDCLTRLKADADSAALSACRSEAYKSADEMLASWSIKPPVAGKAPREIPQFDAKHPTPEQAAEILAYLKLQARTVWQALLLTVSPKRVLFGMLANPAFLIMVIALWGGLVHYVDALWPSRLVNGVAKLVLGTLHFLAHMSLLLVLTAIFSVMIYAPYVDGKNDLWTIVAGVAAYTGCIVALGGILGGMVWGAYWAFTSALFGMHMDAFSALGIANYKNFLRMSFEPDQLTIYPIGLDKVPGRRGWRAPLAGERLPAHNPLILPKRPLAPKLLEEPIVIKTASRRSPS